ncbi:MAG TPA: AMP-binding protein [Candidatus Angelobacter sp.]|nr:AMP-binding protein [Candidatus Angelobacter sp.]
MQAAGDLGYNLIHRFNVGDALRRSAARYPQKRAMHFQGRDLSYAEMDQLSNQVARLLLSQGIGRGDTVAILAANSPEYAAVFFGCARIGAVLVPINLMFIADDVDYVFEKTRVKALIMEEMFAGKVNRCPDLKFTLDHAFRERLGEYDGSPVEQFVEGEDPSVIIFTSGTTARPKGVVLNHLNWFSYLLGSYAEYGLDRTLRYVLTLPMFHVAGLGLTFTCLASGCDSVVTQFPKADSILEAIVLHQASVMALPATLWVGLMQLPEIEKADLTCLRRLLVFQYLPTPIFQRWRAMAPNAEWINCWGQTETNALGSSTPPEDLGNMLSAPDPIGIEHMPLELRIVDEDMKDVEPGKPGEVVVRGPCVTPGYFEDPTANEALFRGGWHHTGDVAYRDQHGWLYFLDRKKDMIKSGGENVSSQEVEEAIAQYNGVAEVAVIGVSDLYWIEKVVACVVPAPGMQLTEDEVLAHARGRLASYKVPKQVFIMNEFPKNPSGKVLKRVLRDQVAAKPAKAAAV